MGKTECHLLIFSRYFSKRGRTCNVAEIITTSILSYLVAYYTVYVKKIQCYNKIYVRLCSRKELSVKLTTFMLFYLIKHNLSNQAFVSVVINNS